MFRLLLALVRLAKEVRRIREILEIAFAKELTLEAISRSYNSKDNLFELDALSSLPVDEYGDPLDEETPEEKRDRLELLVKEELERKRLKKEKKLQKKLTKEKENEKV